MCLDIYTAPPWTAHEPASHQTRVKGIRIGIIFNRQYRITILNGKDDRITIPKQRRWWHPGRSINIKRTVNQMFQTAFDKAFELCLGSPWPWETDFLALSGFRDRTILLTYSWTNPCIRERSRVLLLLKIYKEAVREIGSCWLWKFVDIIKEIKHCNEVISQQVWKFFYEIIRYEIW